MDTKVIDKFRDICHDSFFDESEVVQTVSINKGDRFMVASLAVTAGEPLLAVTVLNLKTKFKEYDSVFRDSKIIEAILGYHSVPELI